MFVVPDWNAEDSCASEWRKLGEEKFIERAIKNFGDKMSREETLDFYKKCILYPICIGECMFGPDYVVDSNLSRNSPYSNMFVYRLRDHVGFEKLARAETVLGNHWFDEYGLVDSPEQFMETEVYKFFRDLPVKCFISMSHYEKDSGIRWHKWGAYLGNADTDGESITDSTGFEDGVYSFHIYVHVDELIALETERILTKNQTEAQV